MNNHFFFFFFVLLRSQISLIFIFPIWAMERAEDFAETEKKTHNSCLPTTTTKEEFRTMFDNPEWNLRYRWFLNIEKKYHESFLKGSILFHFCIYFSFMQKKYLNKNKNKKTRAPNFLLLFNFLVLKNVLYIRNKKRKEKTDLSNNKKYEIEI